MMSRRLAAEIATCLRRMDSRLPGELLAAAIALRRVLDDQEWTVTDLANWVIAQAECEAALFDLATHRTTDEIAAEARANAETDGILAFENTNSGA